MREYIARPQVIASLLLCDDIRMEVGNKPSYMGIYTGDIVFEAFPAVLTKICAVSSVSIDKKLEIQKISSWILIDDQEIMTTDLQIDQIPLINNQSTDGKLTRNLISLNLVISPFEVKKEGVLEVGFTVNEANYLAGRAQFLLADPSQPSKPNK